MILHIQLHLAVKWKAFPRGFFNTDMACCRQSGPKNFSFFFFFFWGRKRGVRLIHEGSLYNVNYGIQLFYQLSSPSSSSSILSLPSFISLSPLFPLLFLTAPSISPSLSCYLLFIFLPIIDYICCCSVLLTFSPMFLLCIRLFVHSSLCPFYYPNIFFVT